MAKPTVHTRNTSVTTNYCKKKGHLVRKCRKKIQDSQEETHRVTEEDTLQDDQFYRMAVQAVLFH